MVNTPRKLGRLRLAPHAHNARVLHVGALEEERLELGGRNLVPLVLDELLDAVDDARS
jgi:hypothetical protein